MKSVPVLVLLGLGPASSPSHLSNIILTVLVICGCLDAGLDEPVNILIKQICNPNVLESTFNLYYR